MAETAYLPLVVSFTWTSVSITPQGYWLAPHEKRAIRARRPALIAAEIRNPTKIVNIIAPPKPVKTIDLA
jgi:hypothetical protein